MIKPTERMAFNFLRSYFDVLNELLTDEDRLNFLLSIINKQFLNEDPKDLNFTVNLCYQSQRHAIEASVKGWIRATKPNLSETPPTNPKEEEEEEKEEEKEKEVYYNEKSFLLDWEKCRTHFMKQPTNIKKLDFHEKGYFSDALKNYTDREVKDAMVCLFKQEVKNISSMFLRPKHFLESIDKYVSASSANDYKLYGSIKKTSSGGL